MPIIISLFLATTAVHAQYLGNEPAVAPLLAGIRFCAMEPMAGAQDSKGLQWLKEVKSGDQLCTHNAAVVKDSRGALLVYANSAGQLRGLKINDSATPSALDESTCRQIKGGATGPDFNLRDFAERVALQQKRILLESEAARPARTTEDRLQFALCHDSLKKLLSGHGLTKHLTKDEDERLTRVHRGQPVLHGGGGAADR